MDKELTLEELDKVTAGYPVLPQEENEEVMEATPELPPLNDNSDNLFITDNQRAVEGLPYGELSEEELDTVIAGRTR